MVNFVRENIVIYLFWQKKQEEYSLYHISDLPVAMPLMLELFVALLLLARVVAWMMLLLLLLSHHHCLSPDQLVRPAPLQQAEADRQDDDHHLDGEEEDDGEDDGGEVGGGEVGDGGEAAVEEEGVVGGRHKDALGVLRYQPDFKMEYNSQNLFRRIETCAGRGWGPIYSRRRAPTVSPACSPGTSRWWRSR